MYPQPLTESKLKPTIICKTAYITLHNSCSTLQIIFPLNHQSDDAQLFFAEQKGAIITTEIRKLLKKDFYRSNVSVNVPVICIEETNNCNIIRHT